jgi:hypothetical protein
MRAASVLREMWPANPQVIQLPPKSPQASFDVAQTLAKSELREGHGEKLVPAGKTPDSVLAVVTRHTVPEFVSGNEIHQLREHRLARVHCAFLLVQKDGEPGRQNSNRKRVLSLLNSYLPKACRKAQNAQPDATAVSRLIKRAREPECSKFAVVD